MCKQPIEYLNHILDECRFILITTSGTTKDQLLEDEVMKRAVVRSLEIIGEACKKIPELEKQIATVIYDQETVINNKQPNEP